MHLIFGCGKHNLDFIFFHSSSVQQRIFGKPSPTIQESETTIEDSPDSNVAVFKETIGASHDFVRPATSIQNIDRYVLLQNMN